MRTLPAKFNTKHPGTRVVFFAWTRGSDVNLSLSYDGCRTFVDCVAARDPGQPSAGFPTADADNHGNIYISYTQESKFHTYLVTLPVSKLRNCNQFIGNDPVTARPPQNDPQAVGFSKPGPRPRGTRTSVRSRGAGTSTSTNR